MATNANTIASKPRPTMAAAEKLLSLLHYQYRRGAYGSGYPLVGGCFIIRDSEGATLVRGPHQEGSSICTSSIWFMRRSGG
jgi:hypothetical protein